MKTLHGEEPLQESETLTDIEKYSIDILRSRFATGRKKYGVGILTEQHADPIDWVDEAIEECADQLQYLVALKLTLMKNDA